LEYQLIAISQETSKWYYQKKTALIYQTPLLKKAEQITYFITASKNKGQRRNEKQ